MSTHRFATTLHACAAGIIAGALALSASSAIAAEFSAVAKTPIKPGAGKATVKEVVREPVAIASKKAGKTMVKPVVAEPLVQAGAVTAAGAYESNGNLLTIVPFAGGKPDEHNVVYIPDLAKLKRYCPYFGTATIPAGANEFNAQRYTDARLPEHPTQCNMHIKADGKKAEIVEMSKTCQQLCGEAQPIPNPGVLMRATEK